MDQDTKYSKYTDTVGPYTCTVMIWQDDKRMYAMGGMPWMGNLAAYTQTYPLNTPEEIISPDIKNLLEEEYKRYMNRYTEKL